MLAQEVFTYEYFDMYVLVIVRHVIISYRAFISLGTLYIHVYVVVRNEPSFDFAYLWCQKWD